MANKNHFSKKVEQLNGVSVIADTALNLGEITSDEHQEIKKKNRNLERDNIFEAMAAYCNNK